MWYTLLFLYYSFMGEGRAECLFTSTQVGCDAGGRLREGDSYLILLRPEVCVGGIRNGI